MIFFQSFRPSGPMISNKIRLNNFELFSMQPGISLRYCSPKRVTILCESHLRLSFIIRRTHLEDDVPHQYGSVGCGLTTRGWYASLSQWSHFQAQALELPNQYTEEGLAPSQQCATFALPLQWAEAHVPPLAGLTLLSSLACVGQLVQQLHRIMQPSKDPLLHFLSEGHPDRWDLQLAQIPGGFSIHSKYQNHTDNLYSKSFVRPGKIYQQQ